MKKFIASLLVAAATSLTAFLPAAQAAGGGLAWDKFPVEKMNDQAALQRGAKLFVNYCLNCHSAAFVRFNKLRDIGLTDLQIKDNLLFTGEKVGDLMKISMDSRQAKEWLGATPPDLTLVARSRAGHNGTGADYLYTYLRTYYRDETKATGWNNLAFPSVGMPHVLWELQGERRAIFDEKTHEFTGKYEQLKPGKMSTAEYDGAVGDLVAFMTWMAEPAQGLRTKLGLFVLAFLAVFFVIAWRLNAAFWKDIK
ncbi:cytochrome c1 [Sphaerotilus microaerophilus]|jgi:ubiquinol-cytochrome c reductase cytochrome c1 subunit|uniref:Cytochrome c1 n=1 Tax=Sphaerotilus microaerophilus TaxID=2914710 RepID=A0ABN6PPJ3_9BURK|nr:cytochrome c1 [Sphaerotilus sp. FB-5]BDI07124.1 cytochrome c1 [Sphaerotilus sp. FB-5]